VRVGGVGWGGDVYNDRSTIKRDMEQIWAYHKAAFFLALGLAFVFGLVLVSTPPVSLYVRAMQQWQTDIGGGGGVGGGGGKRTRPKAGSAFRP
jgi:hypothetical protein